MNNKAQKILISLFCFLYIILNFFIRSDYLIIGKFDGKDDASTISIEIFNELKRKKRISKLDIGLIKNFKCSKMPNAKEKAKFYCQVSKIFFAKKILISDPQVIYDMQYNVLRKLIKFSGSTKNISFAICNMYLPSKSEIKFLNKFFNLVLFPDESTKNLYKNCCLKTDARVFNPYTLIKTLPSKKHKKNLDTFVFFVSADDQDSSRILAVIKAFQINFYNLSNVLLRINLTGFSKNNIQEITKYIKLQGIDNIILTTTEFQQKTLASVISWSDCVISFKSKRTYALDKYLARYMNIPVIAGGKVCEQDFLQNPSFYSFTICDIAEDVDSLTDKTSEAMMDVYFNKILNGMEPQKINSINRKNYLEPSLINLIK